jgi:Leucine rich repeat
LFNNALIGTIPSSLGSLKALNHLDLWVNELTGTIPSSLGSLTALLYLGLSINKLTGTIPSSLGSLTALTTFHLFNNALTGTLPFCIMNHSYVDAIADCEEVSCPCCTHCCPTSQGGIPASEFCIA